MSDAVKFTYTDDGRIICDYCMEDIESNNEGDEDGE